MSETPELLWTGSMPEAYEKYLVPTLFQPFARDLAARAAGGRTRVLELAAGTGVLTRHLAAAGAGLDITATDINPGMVAQGSANAPGAEWRAVDATDLPFSDGEFDQVLCQFGVMFFPDKVQAFREARRVLDEGGRLLFNTWRPVAEHGFTAALESVLDELLPEGSPPFIADVPHGYCDESRIRSDLEAAGFESVEIEVIELEGTADSPVALAKGYALGTPVREDLEATGDIDAMTDKLAQGLADRLGQGELRRTMRATVVTAT